MVRKRLMAFAIDYLLILAYAGGLLALTLLVSKAFALNPEVLTAGTGQVLGFATLTLPVILYFTLSEHGRHGATIGKRRLKLRVVSTGGTKAGFARLLLRNGVKFLPWELAHFFVFRLFQFNRAGAEPPAWVLTGLIAAQGLALIYLLCLIFNKNHCNVYEWLSRTRVVQKEVR